MISALVNKRESEYKHRFVRVSRNPIKYPKNKGHLVRCPLFLSDSG